MPAHPRLALALALAALPSLAPADDGRERLIGLYRAAPQPLALPGEATVHALAEFAFDGARNQVTISAFADAELTRPLLTYRSDGTVEVEGPSDAIEGAWDVTSRNDISTVEIFADMPELWQGIGLGACPLEVGAAVDVRACVAGGPLHVAGCTETDVLWLSPDGAAFRTGGGDANRCEERPTELGELDYRRVE